MPELVTPLKIVHILAAVVALGSNVTYAFWLRWAGRDRDRLGFALDGIGRLDRTFANPAYILLLLTGVGMVLTGAFRFEQFWIAAALALYVLTAVIGITLYAPTLRRQREEAARDPSSPAYAAVERRSTLLGVATIAIVVLIVILMVAKPDPLRG
jgi:uncharacterized membrane protein